MTYADNRVYVSQAKGIQIIDVSNPLQPKVVGSCGNQSDLFYVTVVGKYAYLVSFRGGLRVVDISDPQKPREVGSYDKLGQGPLTIHNNYAYVVEAGRGLAVLKLR